ncbi:MAG: SdpI family protein [Corynebacterium sp.]|nr:SdpI family protein [Corynebacterium sp.]
MSIVNAIIGVVLLVIALIQCIVGIAGWKQKLPGNPYIGIRVPEVRKSQDMWNKAHLIAGPLWTLAGICLAVGGVISLFASGWLWALPIIAVVGWLVFVGMGAGMAANAVAFLDAKAEEEGGCGQDCNCGDSGCENAPAVNLDAVKNAAASADSH